MKMESIRIELARRRLTRRFVASALGIPYYRFIRLVNEYTEPSIREAESLAAWLRDSRFYSSAPTGSAATSGKKSLGC